MSDFANPYQSPEAASVPERPLVPQRFLTDTMLRYLKEASPWIRFIGIIGFIGAGCMAFGGIIFSIVMAVVPDFVSQLDELEELTWASGLLRGVYGAMGLFYVAISALVFFPALFTYRFGNKLRMYLLTNTEEELELAFKNNKSYWKFQGILYIISLAVIPVLMIAGIVLAIMSATGVF